MKNSDQSSFRTLLLWILCGGIAAIIAAIVLAAAMILVAIRKTGSQRQPDVAVPQIDSPAETVVSEQPWTPIATFTRQGDGWRYVDVPTNRIRLKYEIDHGRHPSSRLIVKVRDQLNNEPLAIDISHDDPDSGEAEAITIPGRHNLIVFPSNLNWRLTVEIPPVE